MFIGRIDQLEALSNLWSKRTSSLVTCRGRRRIGKSTLIEEFAKRTADHFINITGLSPRKGMTDVRQRKNFCEELADFRFVRRSSTTGSFRLPSRPTGILTSFFHSKDFYPGVTAGDFKAPRPGTAAL